MANFAVLISKMISSSKQGAIDRGHVHLTPGFTRSTGGCVTTYSGLKP